MNIVPTTLKSHHIPVSPIPVEQYVEMNILPTIMHGLTCRYSVKNNPQHYDNVDGWWYPTNAGNTVEISEDNKTIILQYLQDVISKKEKIVIVEIGVHRNPTEQTSTGVFLKNKRDNDIYIGIDIEDKSFLNDSSKNIYTIKSPSENTNQILSYLKNLNIDTIDVLMIDGWHSINQVYKEWEYTSLLSIGGVVIFHDTNGHPGPYFILKSIDTSMYDVYKYLTDVKDFGIAVAIRKQ